ncbi:DgyrCDS10530 [Dimorphilus gyrociliatus]|uniref:DgyrCDS10530 n=1 Tax=Dimorphilus gyrociliatus TaxID=2664684 RepID=A0A7I8W0H3_9ANNE|nr:DgyrCDS10530 [Dimorphilus gyrociliatus]
MCVIYEPDFTYAKQFWDIEFEFKTQKKDGFLLEHIVTLHNRSLNVVHILLVEGRVVMKLFDIGSASNNVTAIIHSEEDASYDQWNKVFYSLSTRGSNVFFKVNEKRRQRVKYNEKFRILQKWHKTSITIGGRRGISHKDDKKFVGCMKSPIFIQDTEIYEVRNSDRKNVKAGCINACDDLGFRCNDGICINRYDHIECDCFGTKYYGDTCHISDSPAVTLTSQDFLFINLTEERLFNLISLEFKTVEKNGVIFLGLLDPGNYLIIYLLNGTLQVSIVFNDESKEEDNNVELDWNTHLNDNRWHKITLKYSKKRIDIILDGVEESIDSKIVEIKQIYYGASLNNINHAKMTTNFTGCLKNYFFNTFNPLSSAVQKRPSQIKKGCHINQNSVKFVDKKSSFSYGNEVWSDDLKVVFDIRTFSENGLVLFNQYILDFDQGFIQLLMQNGMLFLEKQTTSGENIRKQLHYDKLNDNTFHEVTMIFRKKQAMLVISVKKSITFFKFKSGVRFHERVHLGNWAQSRGGDSFIGCLSAVSLNKYNLQEKDYVDQAFKHLEIGSCNLENICSKQSCIHGNCISLFHAIECDCSGTFYNGKYCQFSRLKSSCQEYADIGLNETGFYLMDLDMSRARSHLTTFCNMNNPSQTAIKEELASEYLVEKDQPIKLDYRNISIATIESHIKQFGSCNQSLLIECSTNDVILQAAKNSQPRTVCKSILPDEEEKTDYISFKTEDLPLTEIIFKNVKRPLRILVGDLVCQTDDRIMSFPSAKSKYLKSLPQIFTTLSFYFKANNRKGIIWRGTQKKTEWILSFENSRVTLGINFKDVKNLTLSVEADGSVLNLRWHSVVISMSKGQIRLEIDNQYSYGNVPHDME